MLRITCPYCGTRDETEFKFGGESHITRPKLESGIEEWTDYLFNKDNPKGIHCEMWLHKYGCGRWFNIVRDTVSHEIHAAYEMGEPRPELPETDY